MRTHGLTDSPVYRTWRAMLQRCNNPRCASYKDYGGRGIKVCKRWLKFEAFVDDMGLQPPGKQIERIDNDDWYHVDNCRWASATEQAQNRRTVRLDYDKVRMIRERAANGEQGQALAAELGVSIGTVSMVINRKTWKNVP